MNPTNQTEIVNLSVCTETFWRLLLTRPRQLLSLAALLAIFAAPAAEAVDSFIWDANTGTTGAQDGGGTWATAAGNWFDTTATLQNQNWVNANLNPATFGGGADGSYAVTLSGAVQAQGGITFNNSGYTLSGTTLNLTTATVNGGITVAANKTATINCAISGNNAAQATTINAGSVLNLGGGFSGAQYTISGAGTLNITGGTSTPSVPRFNTAVINQTGGTVTTGSGGSWVDHTAGRNVNYTISGGTLSINQGSGSYLGLGRGNSTGTLTVQTGGTVNVGTISAQFGNLFIAGNDTLSNGKLDVQGGTLTVGTSQTANVLQFFGNGGSAAAQTATMTQSGGNVTANGIQFGGTAGTYNATSLAKLQLSGGSLYVGVNGITIGSAAAALPYLIQLQGGTLGASAVWTSPMNMKLGAAGVTIQAADSGSTARNITLSGVLSDDTSNGTFTKTGGGTLTLNGTNTYSGATVINAGAVALGANASISNSVSIRLAAGATLDVSAIANFVVNTNNVITAAGRGTNVGSSAAAIIGNASGSVDLGTNNIILTYDGSHPALFVTNSTLKVEGNLWTVNGAALTTVGTNIIAHQASGSIVPTGTPTVNGTALAAATAANIQFSGGDVLLAVTGVKTLVTVSGLSATNKIYDGGTATTIYTNGYTLSGVAGPDVPNVFLVTNGYTATFSDANVGIAKAVAVAGLSLGGSAAGSYYLVQPTGLTANITNAYTTLALTCANTNVFTGRPYVFLATLSIVSGGWPTNGTVTFTTNSVTLGTATVNATGVASLLATLAPGTYTITAGYPDTANVYGSTNTLTITLGTSSSSGWVWDANTSVAGAQDGSGTWATAPINWWNGTTDIAWDSTAAVFGGGVDGTFTVTNGNNLTATSVTFNNSGYTLAGANTLTSSSIAVAANKTATITSPVTGSTAFNGAVWTANAGATMNVTGNIIGNETPQFNGAGIFNLSGTNVLTQFNMLSTVNQIGGSITPGGSGFVGYGGGPGIYTITNATLTMNASIMGVARAGFTGSFIIQNGATVAFAQTGNSCPLVVDVDALGSNHGLLDVQGGTLTMGFSGAVAANCAINLMGNSGGVANESAIMTQEGGTITAWGGILFGSSSAVTGLCTNSYTMTGGSLYLSSIGFFQGANHPSSSTVTLSGGTVGALQNWTTAMPITLGTVNGNVTLLCDDGAGTQHDIQLSGGVTGSGGLNKSGLGTLTLGGTINYGGSTVVSNGTLAVSTTGNPTNGAVTLDGSVGTPIVSLTANAGQNWSIGTLAFASGSPSLANNFGSLAPSTTIAPIQVSGNVAFTVTPALTIGGTAIAVGTYPLIKYTGSISGTAPTTATLPGYISSGYITNITATKTIALVVTSSTYNPALYWAVGNGAWDINTSFNWTQFAGSVKYTDGSAVVFDDSASGSSPITVTLNTTVNPFSVTANNSTNKSYTIKGTGGMAGSSALSLLGGGTFTLAGTNTYSGGTTLSAGQLNINNGGDNSGANSAIGTGPLTLAAGVALDNTSGSDVALIPSITESWNGSFTYLGSSNSMNLGAGSVTMNQNLTLTVSSNNLTVGGPISDSGNNYTLTKAGNGTLTLGNNNTIGSGGGVTLFTGQINLGNNGSLGSGTFEIDSGLLENVSGSDISASPLAIKWSGNFTYLGASNSLDLGSGQVTLSSGLVVNVTSNTLTTSGNWLGGNYAVTKTGNGTLNVIGTSSTGNGSSMIVNAGTVNLGKTAGYAIKSTTGLSPGLTVNTNGLVVITANNNQIISGASFAPVTLNGGVLDLNGHIQTVDSLLITNSGTLRNSAGFPALTVGTAGARTLTLGGTNCTFDVPGPELDIKAIIAGNGSLLKTGTGLLLVYSNTTYTGSTIVNAGSLELTYPSLSTNSLLSVASNAVLTLDFSTTNTVGSLVINGITYAAGVYNATTDPLYIGGTGSLLVESSAPTINPLPGTIQIGVSGSTIGLTWPTNAGWILQSQTNSLSTGLGTNWVDVPGSSSTTATNITINPQSPSVFYRLRHP